MRMKMERKQLFVPVAIIILALGVTSTTTTTTTKPKPTTTRPTTTTKPKPTTTRPKPTTTRPTTTTKPTTTRRTTTRWTTTSTAWTTGHTGLNLYGKMFTLSNSGGISFYSPYFSATPYYPRTTTTSWTTTTPHYPRTTTTPWTTPPSTQGVSVCLRYITDSPSVTLTLSPSRKPLRLTLSDTAFQLYTNPYGYYQSFKPNIKFFPNLYEEIWTRVCITMDSMKPVAQVFRGSNMSIKKMLRYKYVWSGEPVIDFSGFDGQVTDIQMWDYPLRYDEVYSYMSGGVYRSYQGSVLTWSYISYSSRGYTLLEDVYQWQGKQLINRWGIGRARKWEKAKKFVQLGESMESKTKQL